MQDKHIKKITTEIKNSYNKISKVFSQTRQYNWDEVKEYAEKYVKDGQNILDLGCGNGRLYQLLENYNVNYLGIDISKKLIEDAKEKFPRAKFKIGDISKIKLEKNKYNLIFAIASFHHIPSPTLRQQAINNIYKSLKPGGIYIMTNWNLFQPKYEKYFNKNKSPDPQLEENDTLIPWKNSQGKILANRYYHAFTLKEIEQLIGNSDFEIIENKKSRFNIVTVIKKT